MTKQNWMMIGLLAVLVVVYAVYFTDWFRPKILHLSHAVRDLHHGPARLGAMPSLKFGIGQKIRLTDVRVVAEGDGATNGSDVTMWHLVSESNSIPMMTITYGQYIQGMHPEIKGTRPQDLETNVMYRLIVRAGKYTGEP
jgi:hypothetical protein